ncbi:MAG: single-stranded DNA-binding protein [Odoribacter sp.]|nr:single-stranded DNA-binding protein [Bacteroidales bacterium]MBR2981558.1 single-stranded DNA-binding protein [Odoribacter sp.]
MVNKVILIGNVGADPEVRFLEGGTAVANLRLATTETFTRNGEKTEQTEWHTIVLWRGLAEITQKYVKKGMKLYIEGRLRTRQWEDKDHIKRYTTEIYADTMQMLSRSENSSAQPVAAPAPAPAEKVEIDITNQDDLPF